MQTQAATAAVAQEQLQLAAALQALTLVYRRAELLHQYVWQSSIKC
jgi:hypothetical protein